mgnify:CR=1 FL=1
MFGSTTHALEHLAAMRGQAHALEHLEAAVALVQVADFDDGRVLQTGSFRSEWTE